MFQKIVEKVIQGIPGTANYLDDIIVTEKEHLTNLQLTLSKLKESGFRLRRDKCKFFQDTVEYLGHIIDNQGIYPQPAKIDAIANMPYPKNIAELRSFLGMVNYYDRFTPGLATRCAILNDLLHKESTWCWTVEHSQAVDTIKEALTSSTTLSHYDPKLPLSIACDASQVGIGAVLFHTLPDNVEKPIAYASRKLSKAEKSYTQMQKEALAIVYGIQKFRQYLLGRKFNLITDHKPLLTIFHPAKGIPETAASRLQRWQSYYLHMISLYSTNLQPNMEMQTDCRDCRSILLNKMTSQMMQMSYVQLKSNSWIVYRFKHVTSKKQPCKIQYYHKCTATHSMGGQHHPNYYQTRSNHFSTKDLN